MDAEGAEGRVRMRRVLTGKCVGGRRKRESLHLHLVGRRAPLLLAREAERLHDGPHQALHVGGPLREGEAREHVRARLR